MKLSDIQETSQKLVLESDYENARKTIEELTSKLKRSEELRQIQRKRMEELLDKYEQQSVLVVSLKELVAAL